MFKCIIIQLTEPICNCDEQDITWGINHVGLCPGLSLECKSCKTKLEVPHTKFVASFELDKPYPGKQKQKPKENTERKSNVINVDFKKS